MASWYINLFIYIAILLAAVITYFKWSYQYFKKKNIPHPPPKIPFGNLQSSFSKTKRHACELIDDYYKRYKPTGIKHFGFYLFSKPVYVVMDLDIIKNILIKDFNYFGSRGLYYNEKDDPLSAHLFRIEGDRWKELRSKLSPVFTSGKMKMMFNIVLEAGNNLENEFDILITNGKTLDIKDITGKFTTDVIGSCAFGIECNSFINPDSEFRKFGKEVFTVDFLNNIKRLIGDGKPQLAKKLGITMFSKAAYRFYLKLVKDTIKYREENNVTRNDFMNLLMEVRNGNYGLGTIEEMTAQAFIFLVAGYETSSSAMAYCLFELSQNITIQEKLRREIHMVLEKHNGKLSYEALFEMNYMSQVIDETLRKHPALGIINRICTKPYTIPGTEIVLDKNQIVYIPVHSIHRDPKYFPDPEKFDPERFTEKEKAKRHQCTFLPFGEGPRYCIGMRFGLMTVKIGLTIMLKNFKFTLNENTPSRLDLDPYCFVTNSKQTILLDAKKAV